MNDSSLSHPRDDLVEFGIAAQSLERQVLFRFERSGATQVRGAAQRVEGAAAVSEQRAFRGFEIPAREAERSTAGPSSRDSLDRQIDPTPGERTLRQVPQDVVLVGMRTR